MKTNYRRLRLHLEDEPSELQYRAKRYHPASVLRYKGRLFVIKSGSRDYVSAWSFDKGRRLVTVSINSCLGYAGIEEFEHEDGLTGAKLRKGEGTGESHCCAFFQNVNEELATDLGDNDFFDLGDSEQRDLLCQYLQ